MFKLILGLIFTRKICIDGLNSGKQIELLINEIGKLKEIENISEIKKILAIPSVNLCNGNLVCFTSCELRSSFSDDILFLNDINIGKAIRASCSYPVIFSPCEYNNIKLIDGGIRENVPWKELKVLGAEKVISIVFEEIIDDSCEKNLIEVANRSINLLCRELSNYEMEEADYILKIKSKKIELLDTSKINKLYKVGYEETQKRISEIVQYIKI